MSPCFLNVFYYFEKSTKLLLLRYLTTIYVNVYSYQRLFQMEVVFTIYRIFIWKWQITNILNQWLSRNSSCSYFIQLPNWNEHFFTRFILVNSPSDWLTDLLKRQNIWQIDCIMMKKCSLLKFYYQLKLLNLEYQFLSSGVSKWWFLYNLSDIYGLNSPFRESSTA